jgi:NitT/TauT family transport system substrate-binding protein
MRIRIMASRHSAFYSPLLAAVRFLREGGHDVPYAVLGPGQQTYSLIRDGAADIVQSAVSSNWKLRERGVEPLPVHFAQINSRDGFFLAARHPEPEFAWKNLEGHSLLADQGDQPLAMLKYAVKHNGVDWTKIRIVRKGEADYTHEQGPISAGHIIASVGAAMPPVAFSSLCCARADLGSPGHAAFLTAYTRAREWVCAVPPVEVATALGEFFPGVSPDLLADAIRRYQELGTWIGSMEIPRDLYEHALDVFQAARAITWRHPYHEVVAA